MQAVCSKMVTTAFELPGHQIVENLGIVRGIVVRSRSVIGSIGAGLQTILGGNITIYTDLCETARSDAFQLMLEHAGEVGANGVIGMRYDATEFTTSVTEVLAYGTAKESDLLPEMAAAFAQWEMDIEQKLLPNRQRAVLRLRDQLGCFPARRYQFHTGFPARAPI